AATAAAEPPLDPPGTRDRSHGLRVDFSAEFSVDEPMANSSRLVLPNGIAPAARNFSITVASYGARYPRRIFDAQVHGWPATLMISLIAIGTPPSGKFVSAFSASSAAASKSRERYAPIFPSTALIRSSSASKTSRGDTSRRWSKSRSSAMLSAGTPLAVIRRLSEQ